MNSSTSSSEPTGSARSITTPASLAAALGWTIFWLAGIEGACQLVDRVAALRESPIGRPLAEYLERGESTVRRLRAAWASDEPNLKAMIDAGWIDRTRWRDLPAQRTPDTRHLAAFYGNSFTRQIATEVARVDPSITIRMVFGPVAPASHAYACFLEDRREHESDAVVLGVVVEMLPGLLAMTRATESVVEPSPYTFPRYRLENAALTSVEPTLHRFEDFERALGDPELWAAHVDALERHDAFYSPAIYDESWLDALALTRMLKAAWAIRAQRAVEGPVLASLDEPAKSETVAVLVEILRQFGTQARADGRRPLVLLIDTPTVPPEASRYVRDRLAEADIEVLVTAETCDVRDPRSFAGDGHLSETCATRVAEQIATWIERTGSHGAP